MEMAGVPQALILRLKQKYPKPSIDPAWLQACFDWVLEEHGLTERQVDELFAHVETQFLGSDFGDSTIQGTGFPPDLANMEKGRIATRGPGGGPIICQVNAITEIGHSAFSLRNIRQTRIDRADMAGLAAEEEGDENGNPPQNGEDYSIPSYPCAMLRFVLSDGFHSLQAMEYRRLPFFTLGETPLGCKVLLNNVLIRRGIAFLEPDSTTILPGTRIEELDEMRDVLFSRSLRVRMGLPEIDPEEEEMQQAQLQLQQQQQQNDGEQQQAANPPPPPPQPAQAPRAEHPVARRASPPHVVQRQPPPPPPAGAPVPRSDSARSDTARADRLAKIQRMLEAEASEAETKTKAVPPPARPRNDTAMDEDKPSPFLVQRKPQPPSKASMSRVNPWVGSSHTAATSASARMEVDNEDDYSFDLTPSQELAFNEATLRDLERDLARRSASPTKRAASPQKQKRKLDTGASAPLPAKRAPIQTKVINLVDSGDDDDEEPPPASSSKPKPVPRHTSRVPSTPVSKVRPHRKALPRERSKTVDAAEVIDLSD